MDKTKVSKTRQKKEAVVAELSEKVERAKGVVLTNYQGLTHKQIEEFKKGLRDADAEYVVTKNTLLKIALEKANKEKNVSEVNEESSSAFSKPTAALFVYGDVVKPFKALAKTIKALSLPSIKFGILDGQRVTEEQVLKIAVLPSFEVLLNQLVGGLKSPIYGLHRALNWNLQKFVMMLKAIETKKSS